MSLKKVKNYMEKMKYKMKRVCKKTELAVKTVVTFPHFWVEICIVVLACISLGISVYCNQISKEYISSIFANIFAGLLTGLTLALIYGFKTRSRYKLLRILEWSKELHEKIQEFWKCERVLWNCKDMQEEEFYDKSYEAVCSGNEINSKILNYPRDYATNINFEEYCKKQFKYDAKKVSEQCGQIRESILYDSDKTDYRESILNQLRAYNNTISMLNRGVLKEMEICKYKLHLLDKSII